MGVSDKCVTRTSAQMQALSKERLPRLEGTMINSHTCNQGCSIHTAGAEKLTGVSTFPEAAATWSEGGVGISALGWQPDTDRIREWLLISVQANVLPSRPGNSPWAVPCGSDHHTSLWRAGSPIQPLRSCMVLGTWMVSGAYLLKAFRHICRWTLLILQTGLP